MQQHDTKKMKPRKLHNSMFAFMPLIPHVIVITLVVAGYYYITKHELFPEWINYIYYAVKIIITLEILAASAQTLLAPLLTILGGAALIYLSKMVNLVIATSADGWQLIVLGLIGLLITIVTKF